MDRVIEEAERYRERLDQFDAHGFPNVASALDRVNAAEARAARYEAALRPFVDPAKVSGSVSIVRSDDPPAKPLPTCVNCGSNFIEPAPPAGDEVREAAEALRHKMREVYADSRYMNVWATAQGRLGPYSGPDWIAEAAALDAALAARGGE